ncbi:ACT domain-containing protein [Actinomyces sp. B33]|uniref:ACT domain-containing protein n=1 Tax=Actinomyces sp. B33 TaxID=2942131 RepID=UPI002340EC57|nr:ACT domain-containing protein [Actinomyces sp. B33]MDC4233824.1 ACT domain-containing protein [Actinomyces sp. B33]
MAALESLEEILSSLTVSARGVYAYVEIGEWPAGAHPLAVVVEDEGAAAILPIDEAFALVDGPLDRFALLTLDVHSSLTSVGLTALVSTALARRGISCNVVAGLRHDHLLVPEDRADEALAVVRALASGDADPTVCRHLGDDGPR